MDATKARAHEDADRALANLTSARKAQEQAWERLGERKRTGDPRSDPLLRAAALSRECLQAASEATEATRLAVALLDSTTDLEQVRALCEIVGKAERAAVHASNVTRMVAALGKADARSEQRTGEFGEVATSDATRADLCRDRLLGLSQDQVVRAYLVYAHSVTIEARAAYPEPEPPLPVRPDLSRRCNETLHRLTGHLGRLVSGKSDDQSNRSFAEMVVAGAGQDGCLSILERAIEVATRSGE